MRNSEVVTTRASGTTGMSRNEASDKCDRCKDATAVDTTRHWLTDCEATMAARQEIFGKVDIGMQEMGLQPDKVLKLAGVMLKY